MAEAAVHGEAGKGLTVHTGHEGGVLGAAIAVAVAAGAGGALHAVAVVQAAPRGPRAAAVATARSAAAVRVFVRRGCRRRSFMGHRHRGARRSRRNARGRPSSGPGAQEVHGGVAGVGVGALLMGVERWGGGVGVVAGVVAVVAAGSHHAVVAVV